MVMKCATPIKMPIFNKVSAGKCRHLPVTIAAGILMSTPAFAAETTESQPPPDKSQYTLFNPTPRNLMRELSADRPDKTESAYTVDAGHFQVEMDIVGYTYDHDTLDGMDVRSDAWDVVPVNLKVGLLNNVDFQLVLDTYSHVRTKDRIAGTVQSQSGFGDITTRVKINLWGNDSGATAGAVMPFVIFPTGQDGLGDNAYEGGLIFPFAATLPHGWDMGFTSVFAFLKNSNNSDYNTTFLNSITVSHTIVGELAGYLEFFGGVSTERGSRWVGTVDCGLTYGLNDSTQLDAGINIGVTHAADDLNPFIGLTYRF